MPTANNLNGLDPSEVDSIAAGGARRRCSRWPGCSIRTDGGHYVFAGQDSGNPPVPNPDAILDLRLLHADPGRGRPASPAAARPATIAGDAGDRRLQRRRAPRRSPPTCRNRRRRCRRQLPTVATGPAQQTPIGIPGQRQRLSSPPPAAPPPAPTCATCCAALATIGSLSSAQVNDGGFQRLVQDTHDQPGRRASPRSTQDAGVLGDQQSSLHGRSRPRIGRQRDRADDAGLGGGRTSTWRRRCRNLTQMQTQLQASYQLIVGAARPVAGEIPAASDELG